MAGYKGVTAPEIRFEKYWTPEPNSGCWLWTGADDGQYGYGRFAIRLGFKQKGQVSAHRFSYEMHKGQIPAGLEIDHKCRNVKCVNPDHLEAVTREENMKRASKHGLKLGGIANGARQKAKTHCKWGHEFTPENTRPNGKNGRACMKCRSIRETNRRQAMKGI